jgi:NAD(P) transhydrogenase subunit alpha
MDALSSQATVAGYQAVLLGATRLPRLLPMLTTAAGTLAPAKTFVLGAGVAGLQAVATARRLGAVVSAFDVRPVVKEQVQSLGASFVEAEQVSAEGAGGYAAELAEEQQRKVLEAVGRHIKDMDLVITTAQIPGRPAPTLLTEEAVRGMQPGSVIIDMAADSGGNCELSEPGKTVLEGGVKVIGPSNLPSEMAADASQLYAKNLENLLGLLVDEEDGSLQLDFDDEIVAGACITHEGEIRNERAAEVAGEKQDEGGDEE